MENTPEENWNALLRTFGSLESALVALETACAVVEPMTRDRTMNAAMHALVEVERYAEENTEPCPECDGRGVDYTILEEKCGVCHGNGCRSPYLDSHLAMRDAGLL